MSRWKLAVGLAAGLFLFGCEPPEEKKPPEDVDRPVETPVEAVYKDLQKAKALIKEAQTLLAEGKLDEAAAKVSGPLVRDLQEAKDLLAKIEAERDKGAAPPDPRAELAAKKKQVSELLNAAAELLDEGKLADAEARVDEVLKLDPENAAAKDLVRRIEQKKKEMGAAAGAAQEKRKAELKRTADSARARGAWEAAEKLYSKLAGLETDPKKRAGALDRAVDCGARALHETGQKAENARRYEEARGLYERAYRKKKLKSVKDALDGVIATIAEEKRKATESMRCAELLAGANALAAEGDLKGAVGALAEAAGLERAREGLQLQVAQRLAALTKELNYRECIAAAEAALAPDPPDYAKAEEEYLRAKQFKDLTAEEEEKLIECRFQIAVQNADAAVEAGDWGRAIDILEPYSAEETVAAKLEEVKDRKAASDFAALVAKADEAIADGREEEAVDAYEIGVKISGLRPRPFAEMAKEVAAVKAKLKKAKAARQKKLNARLAGDWKALLRDWKKALKEDARAAKELLLAAKPTFEGSKYAASLVKFLKKTDASIAKTLGKEWTKLKKQVKKGKDREQNIQALTDFLEKVTGTKYEQPVQDQLDAEKQALEEAPPEEPVEPEPVEGAAPPEPVEEPAAAE